MHYTSVIQSKSGNPAVKIECIEIDQDKATVQKRNGQSAQNYSSRYMVQEKLIPEDLAQRAFDGWLTIECQSAKEAWDISDRVNAAINTQLTIAKQARAKRTFEYLSTLIAIGKPIYIRGEKGRFEQVL